MFCYGLVAQLVRAPDSRQLGHLPLGCSLQVRVPTERQGRPPNHGRSGTGLTLVIYGWTSVSWVPN